jgi:hypothetical protein
LSIDWTLSSSILAISVLPLPAAEVRIIETFLDPAALPTQPISLAVLELPSTHFGAPSNSFFTALPVFLSALPHADKTKRRMTEIIENTDFFMTASHSIKQKRRYFIQSAGTVKFC